MNLIATLWGRLQRLGSPVQAPGVTPLAAPALSQDEFPLTAGHIQHNRAEAELLHKLHRRIIDTNNACVERGMGRYTELVAYKPNMRPLSAEEMAKAADPNGLGAVFVEPT